MLNSNELEYRNQSKARRKHNKKCFAFFLFRCIFTLPTYLNHSSTRYWVHRIIIAKCIQTEVVDGVATLFITVIECENASRKRSWANKKTSKIICSKGDHTGNRATVCTNCNRIVHTVCEYLCAIRHFSYARARLLAVCLSVSMGI